MKNLPAPRLPNAPVEYNQGFMEGFRRSLDNFFRQLLTLEPWEYPPDEGKILRSDGDDWVASTSTYPDTVVSGNVLYATATNTVGSSSEFNYNASTDTLTLGAGAAQFTVGAAGEVTMPVQPAFLAELTVDVLNVTGDGTAYTTLAPEIFDQGGDYNPATGTFTAPVAGRYHFTALASLYGITGGMAVCFNGIVTSNRSYPVCYMSLVGVLGAQSAFSGSVLADMDAGDTAIFNVYIDGGAKVVDVDLVQFSGFLAC